MSVIKELQWRGMVSDMTPQIETFLAENKTVIYLGVDPTGDSLHVGHLVPILMLRHLQLFGHQPILVVGGATGMVGDPSGKSQERNLLTMETIRHNEAAIAGQSKQFLSFEGDNAAEITNNFDWMSKFSFLDFIREVGKYITVNYMTAKDSVKSRLTRDGAGLSFTEFTYQLIQGYDFLHLYEHKNCRLQIGGSDQWGNITTGMELIRKKLGGKAYAITCPLVTKADGKKFGKSEAGENIWLDPAQTSPYRFYQFWINVADAEAEKFIKIYSFLDEEAVTKLIEEHKTAPHTRLLQKKLAEEITTMVHGASEYENAVKSSQILFGKGTKETLLGLSESDFLDIFDGIPTFNIAQNELKEGIGIIDFLAEKTNIYASKGEVRRALKGNSIGINKQKVTDQNHQLTTADLLNNKYILAQKGKKNYNLVIVE